MLRQADSQSDEAASHLKPKIVVTRDGPEWTVRNEGGYIYSDTGKVERPGQGEIVGGAEYQLTEEIIGLARKKGGKDEAQNLITSAISTARAEGQRIAAIGERKARVELERIMDERIVCAFIAEARATAERFNSRFPPDMTWNISSLTIRKIMDALYRAGYTARGRRSPPDQAMS